MANNIIKRTWKQGGLVNIEDLRGSAFQAESGGHTFQISGVDIDGNPLALSGTPAGVLLRSDGQDVALTCSVSDGVVFATLPANAYVVPGRVGITIFLTSDGQKTAIYAAVGSVAITSSGTVAPPAGSDVVDLVNAIATAVATIPASYTNLKGALAPTYSTSAVYAVGSYAWYDGKLYKCTTAINSGETWTSGHWTEAKLASDVSYLKSASDAILDEITAEFGLVDIHAGNDLTSGKCIKKDGTTRTGSAWSYTDFIRINCRNLMFTCPEHSYSWVLTEAASVAFYTLANESSFITGSAVDVIEGTIGEYRWIAIPVPDTAKFLRASVLTELASSYKMIGLNSYNNETQINPASGEHDDLDNYKKIGTYTVPSEGAAGRIYNAPFSVGFRLIVGNVNNYNSVYQIAIANETNGIAIRTYDTVNGVWRDWSKGFATAKTVTLDYNEDLNDCTDPGEYIIPNGGVAKSLENCPFTVGGKMTVGKVNNVNSAYQLIMANQENGIAYRTYDAGNSRWRGWSVMESSPQHTTVIEVGTGKEYTSLVECLDDVTSVDLIGTWNENNRLVIQLGEGEYKMDSVVDLYRETKKPDEEIQTQEDRGPYRWGVYMPRYCTIKGAGKTKTKITFDYQGEEGTGKDDGWIMGHIAALNMPYEGGLEDLSIIVQNCRYCVHADGGITSAIVDDQRVARGKTAWLNNLSATIKNVSFIHNGQDQSILDPDDYDYPCAWGSGIRNNVYREFINCEFIAANCPGWSTHNYPENTESAEHRFVNCKFINTETRFAFSYRRASLEFLSWGSDIPINVYLENCYAGRYINLGVTANGSTGALTSRCDFFVHDDGGNFIIPKTTNDAHKMQSWFNRNCVDVMPGSGVTIVAYKPYDINSDWRAVGYGTDANAIMRGIAINDTATGDTITGSVYVQTKGYVSLDLLGVSGFSAGATIDYVNGAWAQDSVDPLIRVLTANIGELI